MLNKYQTLINPVDFDNAMYLEVPIIVYDEEWNIIEYGGAIEKHTDNCVFINGGYFIKANFIFKVR